MGWPVIAFSDAIKDVSSASPRLPQSQYLDSGVLPIIDQGAGEVAGYTDDLSLVAKCRLPVIIFGDHTRRFKIADRPFAVGADGVKLLEISNQFDVRYAYYYLRSLNLPNAGYSRHYKFLREIEIPLPPLPEQRRIAAFLDRAEHARGLRVASRSMLEQVEDEIFRSALGAPGLGFPRMRIDEIARTRLGKMLDAGKDGRHDRKPYLRNANVQWFHIDVTDLQEMEFSAKDQVEYSLEVGDVLVCEGGQPGRCAVWTAPIENVYFQKALHRVRLDRSVMLPEVFVRIMKLLADSGALSDSVSSATIAHLTGEKFRAIEIPVPPMELQLAYVRTSKRVAELDRLAIDHLAKLNELFARLEYNAFIGQV